MNVTVLPAVGGFYLGIQDNTSCIQVAQLEVFRYQCKKKQEGLVCFPETAAPVSGCIAVNASCKPNSSPITSMVMWCYSNGLWSGSGECVCDPGYIKKQDTDGNYFCEACPAGTYRSACDPEDNCLACPANTDMTAMAAPICQCLTNFFRNTEGLSDDCPTGQWEEDASDNCTQPPSKPLNLRMIDSTANSLSISWSPPSYLGGRNDLYYTVEYSDPDNVGVMLMAGCSTGCLTRTSCTIGDMSAATDYVVRVSAHNGVSDQDSGGALARQCDIINQTDIAPPDAPIDIIVFPDVVVWKMYPWWHSRLIAYEICISVFGLDEIYILVFPHMCFYIFNATDKIALQDGGTVKVRAINDAGPGPFTLPQEYPIIDPDQTVAVTTTIVLPPETITQTETSTDTSTVTRTTTDTVSVTLTTTSATTATTTVTETTTATVTSPYPIPTSPITVTVPVISTVTEISTDTVSVTFTTTSTTTATETTTATVTSLCPSPTIEHPVPVTPVTTPLPTITSVPCPPLSCPTTPRHVAVSLLCTYCVTEGVNRTADIVVKRCGDLNRITILSLTPVAGTAQARSDFSAATHSVIFLARQTEATVRINIVDDSDVENTESFTVTLVTTQPNVEIVNDVATINIHDNDFVTETSTIVTTNPTVTPTPTPTPQCTDESADPDDITDIRVPQCGRLEWDIPSITPEACGVGMMYRVRFYSGSTFQQTNKNQRSVLFSDTNSLDFTAAEVPTTRPLKAMVKAKTAFDGGSNWSPEVTVLVCN